MDAKQTPISQIYQVLQKLLGLHRQLLETVRMEREALTSADLKGIQEAAYAKEALIETIRQQESIRLRALGELSSQWNRPLKDLSLPNLIIAVQASDPKFADPAKGDFTLKPDSPALALGFEPFDLHAAGVRPEQAKSPLTTWLAKPRSAPRAFPPKPAK